MAVAIKCQYCVLFHHFKIGALTWPDVCTWTSVWLLCFPASSNEHTTSVPHGTSFPCDHVAMSHHSVPCQYSFPFMKRLPENRTFRHMFACCRTVLTWHLLVPSIFCFDCRKRLTGKLSWRIAANSVSRNTGTVETCLRCGHMVISSNLCHITVTADLVIYLACISLLMSYMDIGL